MDDKDLQSQIDQLIARNKKVESDKARETSRTRKVSIAIITYFLVVLFLYLTNNPTPRINALVPMGGFLLSTLSLDMIKKRWNKHTKDNSNSLVG